MLNILWLRRLFPAALILVLAAAPLPAAPPNIVFILADDLGYGDLGVFGHPTIRTPELDRMAAEGVKLTDFYASSPVCSPTRAAFLTGRLPIRSGMVGLRSRVLFPNSYGGLPAEELTVAEVLRERGYATACIGKWHLGHLPEFLPTEHGFEYYYGIPYSNDMDRAPDAPAGRAAFLDPKIEYWNVPLMRNTEIIERPADQRTLTRRYTEEAIRFMRESGERPFFVYFAHAFPHIPLFASDAFAGKSRRGLYGDVVEEMDWSTGQILDFLREEGLADNTLVIFTSDNGPWLTHGLQGGSSGLLRDGKGSTWEGGVRVPTIAWWPGKAPAGAVRNDLATVMDMLPTFAGLAGARLPQDRTYDGIDILPMLTGGPELGERLFFYYRGPDLYAVRMGSFKAHLVTRPGYGPGAAEEHRPPLLFNLDEDPGELHNIAEEHPEILARISKAVESHRATVQPVTYQFDLRKD